MLRVGVASIITDKKGNKMERVLYDFSWGDGQENGGGVLKLKPLPSIPIFFIFRGNRNYCYCSTKDLVYFRKYLCWYSLAINYSFSIPYRQQKDLMDIYIYIYISI